MKKLLIVTAILLVAFSAQASEIGIYADAEGTVCALDYAAFAPQTTYVGVILDPNEFPNGIVAAEFKIDNYFPNNGLGMVTVEATSQVVIGAMDTDYSIAWAEPKTDAFVLIATMTSVGFSPAWLGTDHVMTIMAGDDCACLVIVDDAFIQHGTVGGSFTFNCTIDCDCLEGTATEDASWSAVKALF
jgi:hypothetical protein